ncbi:MAG: glycosyltransferase, partial [Candidatus Binatia bacterium]
MSKFHSKAATPGGIASRVARVFNRFGAFSRRNNTFKNREGLKEYNFSLSAQNKRPGTSALLRVKNEEDKIFYCLASILDVFDEIVLVDNGSEDQTPALVRDFKQQFDGGDKIKLYFYPFGISRYGPEHSDTPEDSVHSVVYYYNWALSFCSYGFVCKWDGDMVLNGAARSSFVRRLGEVQENAAACWWLYGRTIYRDPAGDLYLAADDPEGEVRLFPNGGNPRFHKSRLYEVLRSDPPLEIKKEYDEVVFYELKFTDV